MNKSDLVNALAEQAGLTKAEAGRAISALFEPERGILAKGLQQTGRIQITGFGTFETKARKARLGRNPRTGGTIKIPASKTPSFRAGKGLRDALSSHHGDPQTDPPPPRK